MNLDEILAARASDAARLWDALENEKDPERSAAAWSLARLVSSGDAGASREWKARADASSKADDPAWSVACFVEPVSSSPLFFDAVAAALARPKVRVGAARAMWLHTKRGGRLPLDVKRALIGAQLNDSDGDHASDFAA